MSPAFALEKAMQNHNQQKKITHHHLTKHRHRSVYHKKNLKKALPINVSKITNDDVTQLTDLANQGSNFNEQNSPNVFNPDSLQIDDWYSQKIQSLIQYATSLAGTPYRFAGGSPETGFDCSGYVSYVYKHELGIDLPHSASAISRIGSEISKAELKPGDLVLFKTLRRTFSHIGIYLGNHHFIHASSTKTGIVEISDMQDYYWARKFVGARRLKLIPTIQIANIENYG